jgi:hypothetical protein
VVYTNVKAANLTDNEVAFLKVYESKGFIFNARNFQLRYFDGVAPNFVGYNVLKGYKVLPGIHRLGILTDWGNLCIPSPGGNACTNYCYGGLVLEAKPGRKYSYDIEKVNEVVNVLVSDETGTVVAKSLCEIYSGFLPDPLNDPLVKSIHDHIEREAKEAEFQDKTK